MPDTVRLIRSVGVESGKRAGHLDAEKRRALPRCCHFGNMTAVDSTVGFGQRLASLLEQRGMTQSDLAARVGVTRAAMSRYVSGDREPRFVTLVRIAQELDVHVDELLGSSTGSVDSAVQLVARARLTEEQKASLRQVLDGDQ